MFTAEQWNHSVRLVDRPSDEILDNMNFSGELMPVYLERKAKWEEIKPDLPAIIAEMIDSRFAECDRFFENFNPDMPHAHSVAYYYLAHYIDLLITYQLNVLNPQENSSEG